MPTFFCFQVGIHSTFFTPSSWNIPLVTDHSTSLLTLEDCKRVLDITCCDEEPAFLGNNRPMSSLIGLARNILLFTLLFDIHENDVESMACYALFYEFYIDESTYTTIRNQAAKLIHLSRTMAEWNECQYGKLLGIVNTATLKVLQQYWLQYSTSVSLNATQRKDFIAGALKYTTLKESELAVLTPAFGALALESVKPAIAIAKEFWKSASMDHQKEFVNPLFVYSSGSGDKFSIHPKAHPLSGFHLASSLIQLTKDSPYFQTTSPGNKEEGIKKRINGLARLQFSNWCKSFQKYIRSTNSLKIRFCVSDPTVLCFALQRVIYPYQPDPLEFYPTGLRFTLDGDQPPLAFNVVDTSDLIDSAGLFNILVSVIPLLEGLVETTLYTSTMFSCKRNKSETELLSSLLIADIGIMCSIFGVVPWNYVRPFGSEGNQHNVTTTDECLNRIIWKVLVAIDPSIHLEHTDLIFEPDHLADILFRIYQGLFPYASSGDQHNLKLLGSYRIAQCTIRGFVMFLTFLKRRIFVNWPDMMQAFLKRHESEERSRPVRYKRHFDLLVELHLFGLWSKDPKLSQEVSSPYFGQRPQVSMRTLSPINYLVLTIPRHSLVPFHQQFLQMDRYINLGLEIAIVTPRFRLCVFSSNTIVFGNLVPSDDGNDCIIEPDASGWDGNSDLHICAYVPGFLFKGECLTEDISIQCLISRNNSAKSLNEIGSTLFEVNLFDTDSVHIFDLHRTFKVPETPQVSRNTPRFSDDFLQVVYSRVNPKDNFFVTRITFFQEEERKLLANRENRNSSIFLMHRPSFLRLGSTSCHIPFPNRRKALSHRCRQT